MALHQLNARTLGEIQNGELGAAIDRELKHAVEDCRDRPRDTGWRKVTLEFALKPNFVDDRGDLEDMTVQFGIKSSVPRKQGRPYVMTVQHDGSLRFNDLSPQAPNQRAMEFCDEPAAESDEPAAG